MGVALEIPSRIQIKECSRTVRCASCEWCLADLLRVSRRDMIIRRFRGIRIFR